MINERSHDVWLLLGWASWWLLAFWPLAGYWTTNPQYAYGWLVPPLALLLAKRRWQVRPAPSQPPPWSKIAVIASAALILPSWLLAQPNPGWRLVPTLLVVSAAAGSAGLCLMLGGRNWARHFAFPICFVLTAVPWPGFLEVPLVQGLMRFVAGCTVTLLNFAGHPAVQRGSLVEIVGGVLGVDEACSGVRSLQATLMAALFLGEWHRLRTGARFGLVAAGFATAVITNVARTSILSFSAARGGMNSANQLHDPAGYTVLTVCLVIVALIAERLRTRYPTATASAFASRQPAHPVAFGPGLCVWLMAVVLATEAWYFRKPGKAIATWTLRPPLDAKIEQFPKTTLELLGCDRTMAASWREGADRQWTLFFLEWFPSRSRTALLAQVHRPEVCLPSIGLVETGERQEVRIAIAGFDLAFESMHFRDPQGQDAFVFYCPWEIVPGVGGRNAAFSDATRAASWRRVWKRERMLGQQVAEFIVSGESSRAAAEAALREQLKRLLLPVTGATPDTESIFSK